MRLSPSFDSKIGEAEYGWRFENKGLRIKASTVVQELLLLKVELCERISHQTPNQIAVFSAGKSSIAKASFQLVQPSFGLRSSAFAAFDAISCKIQFSL